MPSEEQMENAASAWEDRIISVDETDEMICITYEIPQAGNSNNNYGSDDPSVGLDRITEQLEIGDINDFILMPIQEELQNRFGNGTMTVCHRKRPGQDPILEPVTDEPPNEGFRHITPAYPSEPAMQEIAFPFAGNEGYELVITCDFDFKSTGSYTVSSHSEFYGTGTVTTTTPLNEVHFFGVKRFLITPGTRVASIIENAPAYTSFASNDCNGYGSVFNQKTLFLFINGIKIPNLFLERAQWGYSWEISGKKPGCPQYVIDESFSFQTLVSNSPKFNVNVIPVEPDRSALPPSEHREMPNMNCCDEIKKRLDEIERKIDRLLTFSGAGSGGFTVPDSLLDPSPGDNWVTNIWDGITPDKTRHIDSMPKFWMWFIEKLREFFGTWPAALKDDKDNEMVIPNIAEAFKVVVGKELILQRETAATQYATIKCLLESAQTRQQAIYNASLINCLHDFFELDPDDDLKSVSFQISQIDDDNITFEDVDTPKEIAKLCEGAAHKIKIAKIDFKKRRDAKGKGIETFGSVALRSLKTWEAIRTLFGISIDSDDVEGSIRKYLEEMRNFRKGKTGDGFPVGGSDDINDLSLWNEKVEQQFGQEENPPDGAATKPWGDDFENRPRIIIRLRQPTEPDDM